MCGVAAWMGENAVSYTTELLIEVQHRGQEAAGLIYLEKSSLRRLGGPGLVTSALRGVNGKGSFLAIGHVRYSTSGSYGGTLYQPLTGPKDVIGVSYNGNIINYKQLGLELFKKRYNWDAQLVADLIEYLYIEHGNLADALRDSARLLKGAYSLIAVSVKGEIAALRDPWGIRPLAYSVEDETVSIVSETGALSSLGLTWRELPRGTLLYCKGSPRDCSIEPTSSAESRPCAFEYVYFLRPDSVFEGVEAHKARLEMGRRLAEADTVDADLVAPVPDSGRSAALGYAYARGIPYGEVFYRNRYAGRAFIAPPAERKRKLDRKFSPIHSMIYGKKIVLIDDSIVRGLTSRRLVELLRRAGAREVHLRVASPPVIMPCFLGIDMPSRRELIAYGKTINELEKRLGVDSLLYLSVKDLVLAVGRNLCLGCFGAGYPFRIDVEALEQVFAYSREGWEVSA